MTLVAHRTRTDLREDTGLPWCWIDELLTNNLRPDTRWANGLLTVQTAKHALSVLEPLGVHGDNFYPYVCLWTTVIMYDREAWVNGEIRELWRKDLEPRSEPRISFVERWGQLWEVGTGRVIKDRQDNWWWVHTCWRNTERARHFNGRCREDGWCRPCRQLEVLRPYAKGTV